MADSAQLRALVSLLTMDEDAAYRTATHVLPDPVLQEEAAVLLARRRTADEIAAGAVAIAQAIGDWHERGIAISRLFRALYAPDLTE